MQIHKLTFPKTPEQVLALLDLPEEERAGIRVGTARIERGETVPRSGHSQHDQHEISLILHGALDVRIGEEVTHVAGGDITVIPAGEAHTAHAVEDTELLWVFFGASSKGGDHE